MAPDDTAEPIVTWNDEQNRWEARTPSGDLAGVLEVVLRGGSEDAEVVLVHTGVEDAFEGHGVGGLLVRTALDEARTAHRRVVPSCPFARSWIERHPDYADLVVDGA